MNGASAAGPRGATDSDLASRRQDAAFDRLVTTLGRRLTQLGGGESWVLIGGTPDRAAGGIAARLRFAIDDAPDASDAAHQR